MAATGAAATIRLALPKGRMEAGVVALLAESGIRIRSGYRDYRPHISLDGFDVKILKPQNIIEMLQAGSRDLGFAGADWVAELEADVVELFDTGMDPVKIVAAMPARDHLGDHRDRPLVVASEYERLTKRWIAGRGLDARFVRSYGATEVFPPEDADCIVDNAATGGTLRANGLEVVDQIMLSSTRLYAHPGALRDPVRAAAIDRFALVVRSVLEARRRVMLEVNVTADTLEAVIAILPCMRGPTVAPLHGGAGFAVKAAVPKDRLPTLIPEIKARGGTDIVVSELSQIVP
ncbi:MAG: ATP phosphoribosyltransferase [Alphaproteobacteria bacterium]|nr:ATP phosphoribosyltransferase [Alphaproteobacteria bacterium]